MIQQSSGYKNNEGYQLKNNLLNLDASKNFKETQKIMKSKVFNQLEQMVNQENKHHQLTLVSGCKCKVCANKQQQQLVHLDYYLQTVHDGHISLFTLLQHLTMIQADQAPQILGPLIIPMLLFKKQNKKPKDKKQKYLIKNAKQVAKFIVFKSNNRTGMLEYPTGIKSFRKLSFLIKTHQQQNRKLKRKQKQRLIVNFHEVLQKFSYNYNLDISNSQNFIHKKYFNQSIPSYKLPTAKVEDRQSVQQYIIHQQDGYINHDLESYKVNMTEPFCIFRYNDQLGSAKTSKYEIFTRQTLQIYDKNIEKGQLNQQYQDLNLSYVQSYTKIKTQKLLKSNRLLQSLDRENYIETIYFTQYNESKLEYQKCQIFKIAKLQMLIKSKRLTVIDPSYLSPVDLQYKIEETINLNNYLKTSTLQNLTRYKTFKIVHVLEMICGLKVKSLKLKWMLNDYDEVVLLECRQYLIDRQKSLKQRNGNDSHIASIVDNGLSYLQDTWIGEDHQQVGKKQCNIQQIIKYRQQSLSPCQNHKQLENRNKEKADTETKNIERTRQKKKRKLLQSIFNLSKSQCLQGNKNSLSRQGLIQKGRRINLKPLYDKLANKNKKSFPSCLYEYTHGFPIENNIQKTQINKNDYSQTKKKQLQSRQSNNRRWSRQSLINKYKSTQKQEGNIQNYKFEQKNEKNRQLFKSTNINSTIKQEQIIEKINKHILSKKQRKQKIKLKIKNSIDLKTLDPQATRNDKDQDKGKHNNIKDIRKLLDKQINMLKYVESKQCYRYHNKSYKLRALKTQPNSHFIISKSQIVVQEKHKHKDVDLQAVSIKTINHDIKNSLNEEKRDKKDNIVQKQNKDSTNNFNNVYDDTAQKSIQPRGGSKENPGRNQAGSRKKDNVRVNIIGQMDGRYVTNIIDINSQSTIDNRIKIDINQFGSPKMKGSKGKKLNAKVSKMLQSVSAYSKSKQLINQFNFV